MGIDGGIEVAALGFLSPTILELITFRYYIELEKHKGFDTWELLQYICKSMGDLDHHNFTPLRDWKFTIQGDVTRHSTSLMTTQTSEIVRVVFQGGAKVNDNTLALLA
jgi:hypothetical protein